MKRLIAIFLCFTFVLSVCSLVACQIDSDKTEPTTKPSTTTTTSTLPDEPKFSEGLKYQLINNGNNRERLPSISLDRVGDKKIDSFEPVVHDELDNSKSTDVNIKQ